MSLTAWFILVLLIVILIFFSAVKIAIWILSGIRDWWHDGAK